MDEKTIKQMPVMGFSLPKLKPEGRTVCRWDCQYEELNKRNKELEEALDVIASNNGLALSWMSTAPMPLERYKDNCYEMMNIARAALGEKKDD